MLQSCYYISEGWYERGTSQVLCSYVPFRSNSAAKKIHTISDEIVAAIRRPGGKTCNSSWSWRKAFGSGPGTLEPWKQVWAGITAVWLSIKCLLSVVPRLCAFAVHRYTACCLELSHRDAGTSISVFPLTFGAGHCDASRQFSVDYVLRKRSRHRGAAVLGGLSVG